MERKSFVLKDAALRENRITGRAAVMGNLDRGGDVIYPGAFKAALAEFLASGFVADNHDWSRMIAMPKSAREDGNCLATEAVFHSTPDAQLVRQKCIERMENGLSVGLSIGFGLDCTSCAYFDSGKALLTHAESLGHDMSLFDAAPIRAYKEPVRAIMTVRALYEYSIVSVPMNRSAVATGAKEAAWLAPLPTFAESRRLVAELICAELDVGLMA